MHGCLGFCVAGWTIYLLGRLSLLQCWCATVAWKRWDKLLIALAACETWYEFSAVDVAERCCVWSVMTCVDLYHSLGNPQGEAESYRMHDSFSQMLLKDHFQSTQLSEHRLIQVNASC